MRRVWSEEFTTPLTDSDLEILPSVVGEQVTKALDDFKAQVGRRLNPANLRIAVEFDSINQQTLSGEIIAQLVITEVHVTYSEEDQ